ncbi:MAG: FAD-dependent monooxygenase [Bryobacteraceae bacterium]
MAPTIEVPVLVVGGSLVGMSSAMLLGHYGVRSLVVEHHRGTAIHPRAAQITQRTMEIFRTVGVEQIVRKKSAEQFVQDGAIMAVDTLAGKEVAYYIANLNEGIRDLSPCERVFISQSLLEPLLKQRAEELGAELRFATEMISFEQDSTGVTAQIRHRDTGETATVRARYMIAADGAHSRVRERLGIAMQGRGVFSNSITIYFRADVAPLLRGRNLSVIYVINPVLRGFFRMEIPFTSGFLAVIALGDPEHPNTDVSTGLTDQGCLDLLHAALGVDDIPIQIEDVMRWQSEANTAKSFREGNIFLAGDSAHVMPPYGGFGGNTGVQDAQNLAWKLAWVLNNHAWPDLLDSYEAERRPVGEFTVEQAYSRYVTRTAPYLAAKGFQPVAHDMNVELGYCYDGRLHGHPSESKGRPGTRAPHLWLSENCSTLDLFGRDYVLLAGPEWNSTTNLQVHRLTRPEFLSAYGMTSREAVLVRPDGFVEWRGEVCP